MPTSSNKCQNRMPMIVECCDAIVALLCAALFILTIVIMSSNRFEMIDNMIAVDTSFETGEEGPNSPSSFLPWLIVCAIAGVVAAIFGCMGVAPRDHPGCLTTHLLMMLILGVVFLVISMTCSQFETTMEPIIARQVDEFCGPTTYPTYADRLNCSSQPLGVVSPCGADCQERVDLIRGMGRCSFLDGVAATPTTEATGGLCSAYAYQSLQAGSCQVINPAGAALIPPTYTATKASHAECQAACTATSSCSAFSFEGTTCILVSDISPSDALFVPSTEANTTAAILPISAAPRTGVAALATGPGALPENCFTKGAPAVVYQAYNNVFAMASVCYLIAVFMFGAAIIGAVYTFTVATGANAGSKKGLDVILKKMFCPCCWPERGEGRSGKQLTDANLMADPAE